MLEAKAFAYSVSRLLLRFEDDKDRCIALSPFRRLPLGTMEIHDPSRFKLGATLEADKL